MLREQEKGPYLAASPLSNQLWWLLTLLLKNYPLYPHQKDYYHRYVRK